MNKYNENGMLIYLKKVTAKINVLILHVKNSNQNYLLCSINLRHFITVKSVFVVSSLSINMYFV